MNAGADPEFPVDGSPVALVAAPPQTQANAATTLTFARHITRLGAQNKSAQALYLDWTGGTASLGSWKIAAGGHQWFRLNSRRVSLFTTKATPINGTADGNIVIIGEV